MSWKKFVADYLSFSRTDRIGILVLLFLIALVYLIPFFSASRNGLAVEPLQLPPDTVLNQLEAATTQASNDGDAATEAAFSREPARQSGYTNRTLFPFDPNTLSTHGWQQLGLNPRTAKTIANYRNKGGRFYKPEDLKKIWGLPPGFYERVAAYIRIEKAEQPFVSKSYEETPRYVKPRNQPIDINSADTSAFIALPGIGRKLAGRIVAFRSKLGGFYSVEQVGETYGLPDSTFQKIKGRLTVGEPVQKINLNTATKEALKSHPYIKWNLANALVEYRNQHGSFRSLDDVKQVMLADEAVLAKLAPYLEW